MTARTPLCDLLRPGWESQRRLKGVLDGEHGARRLGASCTCFYVCWLKPCHGGSLREPARRSEGRVCLVWMRRVAVMHARPTRQSKQMHWLPALLGHTHTDPRRADAVTCTKWCCYNVVSVHDANKSTLGQLPSYVVHDQALRHSGTCGSTSHRTTRCSPIVYKLHTQCSTYSNEESIRAVTKCAALPPLQILSVFS